MPAAVIDWPEADYELTQLSYHPRAPGGEHLMLQPGEVITLRGKPGPHMKPLCEKGRKAHKLAGDQTLDFTTKLDLVVGDDFVAHPKDPEPKFIPANGVLPPPAPVR